MPQRNKRESENGSRKNTEHIINRKSMSLQGGNSKDGPLHSAASSQ